MRLTVPMTSTKWMESTAFLSRSVLRITIRIAQSECVPLHVLLRSTLIRRQRHAFIVVGQINMLVLAWFALTSLLLLLLLWQ